jgi:hypothetical protein
MKGLAMLEEYKAFKTFINVSTITVEMLKKIKIFFLRILNIVIKYSINKLNILRCDVNESEN